MKTQKKSHYFILSGIMLIAGLLFYALYNELIIIRLPSKKRSDLADHSATLRKRVKLTYWQNNAFATEDTEILYSTNSMHTLEDLITRWLSFLHEEGILTKKVTLQSVMIDKSGSEAFLSFDRSPLPKELSTHAKLMWIEGLLKTVKESGLPIKSVRILVQHKPLYDQQLDFNYSWPLSGYTKSGK